MPTTMRANKKILVLGSGPSTRALVECGLDHLRSDVDTFGMGAEYRFFRKVGWWPTFYALGDSKEIAGAREECSE